MILLCCASELGLPEDLSAIEVILFTSWLPGFARDPPSLALPPIRPSLPRITRLRPEHLQFHRSK